MGWDGRIFRRREREVGTHYLLVLVHFYKNKNLCVCGLVRAMFVY